MTDPMKPKPADKGSKEQRLADLQEQIDELIEEREAVKAEPEQK